MAERGDTDIAVIGAGIVGLATTLALSSRGFDVTVLDKEPGVARHQTGRNSGVVHSGLYYTPGSAKAQLVARGRQLLDEHCARWGVPIDYCGKVVVATDRTQLAALATLEQRGRANGVELARIGPARLTQLEPHVTGVAALHVPHAGIVDYGAVALAMAAELIEHGSRVLTGADVHTVHVQQNSLSIAAHGVPGGELRASYLVNCAGLHSDHVARLAGCEPGVHIVPFHGEYHELTPEARALVRDLVYPVPDPRWPFLGVHMTRMVDGSVHVGPNTVLALGREAYDGGMDRDDLLELLGDPGLRRLAAKYWRTGATELIRSRFLRLLVRDARRLIPEIGPDDLVRSGAGIRAQALAPDGSLLDDFAFASSPRAVHVINAPSPAATASLAIGEVVADRLVATTQDI